jgi:hypothetical protein
MLLNRWPSRVDLHLGEEKTRVRPKTHQCLVGSGRGPGALGTSRGEQSVDPGKLPACR